MDYMIPRGNITTVLDYVDRDIQDDTFFPYTCETSWFAPTGNTRSVPFTPTLQSFSYRGPAAYGQKIVVDIDNRAGDLLHSIFIQIQLEDIIPEQYREALLRGDLHWKEEGAAHRWIDRLGVALIEEASLQVGEVVLEELDTVFSTIALTTWPDANMQRGLSTAIEVSEDGRVTCLLPFWFSRTPYKESMPLIACNDGDVKLHLTFRRFEDVVRIGSGIAVDSSGTEIMVPFIDRTPGFRDINILTYGSLLTGEMRDMYQEHTFEHIYRPIQRFVVDNPIKYGQFDGKYNHLTIPLPFNGPVEELLWVVRRRGAGLTTFSFNDMDDPILRAHITINGSNVVDNTGKWFRAHIAGLHRGASHMYASFLYGYSFARTPGEHQPSGTANFSRANNVELRLTVRNPGDDNFEVHVFAVGLNWLQFQNGICGRVFST